jgi:hypothetical protein
LSINAKTICILGKFPKIYGGSDIFSPNIIIDLFCLFANISARLSRLDRNEEMVTKPVAPFSYKVNMSDFE